jgi:predicted DNA-binding protein
MPEQKTPQDVPVSLRMPADTVDKIRHLARESERTFSQEVRLAVRKHVAEQQDRGS